MFVREFRVAWHSIAVSRLARKAMLVFVNNWVSNIAHFACSVYIVRKFGPEGRGIYTMLTTASALFAVLLSMGIVNAVIYFVKSDRLSPQTANRIVAANGLVGAAAVSAILWEWGPYVWTWVFEGVPYSRMWAACVVLYMPIVLQNLFLSTYFLSQGDIGKHRILTVLMPVTCSIAAISAAEYSNGGIAAVVWAWVLSEGVFSGVCAWRLVAMANTRHVVQVSTIGASVPLKEIYWFGLRGHMGTVGTSVLTRVDVFIIGVFSTVANVGLFTIAKFLHTVVLSIPNALAGLLLGTYCDRGHEAACALNRRVELLLAFVLGVVVCVGCMGGRMFLVAVYGENCEGAVASLYILLVSAFFLGCATPSQSLFIACGRPGISSKIGVMSGCFRVLLTFLLTAPWAVVGASLAHAIASFATYVMRSVYVRRVCREVADEQR